MPNYRLLDEQCKSRYGLVRAAKYNGQNHVGLRLFLLSGGSTRWTDASIVELSVLNDKSLGHTGKADVRNRLVHQVKDPTTLLAEEMHMGHGVAIIADAVVIDSQHLGSITLRKKAQRIIYRGTGERFYGRNKGHIHILHGGMGVMGKQIVHNGYPLFGGVDATLLQSIVR